jgi:hypothetical protein
MAGPSTAQRKRSERNGVRSENTSAAPLRALELWRGKFDIVQLAGSINQRLNLFVHVQRQVVMATGVLAG